MSNVSEIKIAHLKHLLSFASLREKRNNEIYKLKIWLNKEYIRCREMKEEYRLNTIYSDPEVKEIVQMQIDLAEKLYNIIDKKHNELVRFVQNGDCLLKTHANNDVQFQFAYPSTIEIEQMDIAPLVLDIGVNSLCELQDNVPGEE